MQPSLSQRPKRKIFWIGWPVEPLFCPVHGKVNAISLPAVYIRGDIVFIHLKNERHENAIADRRWTARQCRSHPSFEPVSLCKVQGIRETNQTRPCCYYRRQHHRRWHGCCQPLIISDDDIAWERGLVRFQAFLNGQPPSRKRTVGGAYERWVSGRCQGADTVAIVLLLSRNFVVLVGPGMAARTA